MTELPVCATKEQIEEVAAIGFNASVRLLSCRLRLDSTDTLNYIARELERDVEQVKWWTNHGVSKYIAVRYLKLLHDKGIAFGIHQLLPTRRIAAMHQWRSNK